MDRRSTLALAGAVYAAWVAATWMFEGRIGTFLRPAAVADRITYALGVNLLLGMVVPLLVLRRCFMQGALQPARSGFGTPRRSALAVAAGLALGALAYFGQGAPSTDPVLLANAFAQVFVVSAAEVLVCWCLVAAAVEAALAPARLAAPLAAVAAAGLFGLYHFAHSPPFDTWPMVALLSVVGLVTGAFFLASRDVLGTIVFHNFLATYGVTQALVAGGSAAALGALQWPLIASALVTVAAMLAGSAWVRRR